MVVLRWIDKPDMQGGDMKKIIFQGLIIVVLFFATWYVLYQVDWMCIFRVEKVTKNTEEKLGELLWDIFRKSDKEINDPFVTQTVDSLITRISGKNNIDRSRLKVHVLKNADVNAFALPNNRIVIYSGLIHACGNPEELCGVIAHEMAHIELNHVMKKLIREVGLSVIVSMTTGSGGSDMIREAARIISSTAYDRNLEREADARAVDYLTNAGINPEQFAGFLFRLSETEPKAMKQLSMISTHPELEERVENILERSRRSEAFTSRPVITTDTWRNLMTALKQ
jgi:beta-barrel assembly-enhancing protease